MYVVGWVASNTSSKHGVGEKFGAQVHVPQCSQRRLPVGLRRRAAEVQLLLG